MTHCQCNTLATAHTTHSVQMMVTKSSIVHVRVCVPTCMCLCMHVNLLSDRERIVRRTVVHVCGEFGTMIGGIQSQ